MTKSLLEKAKAARGVLRKVGRAVLTPEEVELLLAVCSREVTPAQAAKALGVDSTRSSIELQRLLWRAVRIGLVTVIPSGPQRR